MNKSLARSTLYVTSFSIISILLNLILQLIVAFYFGAKFSRDAYLVAISIPLFVTTVINGSLGYIFIPSFVEFQETGNQKESQQFLFSITIFLVSFLLSITLLFYFFDELLIKILFPSFDSIYRSLVQNLLIILLPTILLNVLSAFLSSLYQIQGNFLMPAMANAFNILLGILFFLIFKFKLGIYALAYGYTFGSLFSILLQIPILKHVNFTFKTKMNFGILLKVLKLAFPLFIGGIFFRFSIVFEKIMASHLAIGSVSYLGYSGQIITVLGTLTSNSVSTVMFPLISKYWSNRNFESVKYYLSKSLKLILLLTIPTSIYLVFFGKYIIRETFERGAFTPTVSGSVYWAIVFSMGGFIFQSIGSIIVKLFYISGHTTINTIISSFELILYMLLANYLVNDYSFLGLPIALSISSGISIFISLFFLNYRIIKINYLPLVIDFLKLFILSFLSILLMYYVNKHLFIFSDLISFLISNFIGGIIFVILCFWFKVDEIRLLITRIRSINIK